MGFLNTNELLYSSELYQQILFFVFGIIAVILLVLQVALLLKLNLTCVKLLVFLSFCMSYENFSLFANTFGYLSTDKVYSANFFHACIIPIFVVFLFEITLRLYEARSAVFICIPFDQGVQKFRMGLFLWSIRGIAIGLFIINILVNYGLINSNGSDGDIAGNGGYISLAQHHNSNLLWLALIPPITLSAIGILIMIQIYRYGQYMTWDMKKNDRWKILIIGVLGQTIGEIFGTKTYAVTSNAGEICLLISSSVLLLLIQRELASAANFAEYLHRSNVAFNYFDAVKSENIEAEQQQRPGGGRESIQSARRESISISSLGGVNKITLLIEKTETDHNKIDQVVSGLDEIELSIDNNNNI